MKISKPIYNANLEALAHLSNSTLYKKDNEIFFSNLQGNILANTLFSDYVTDFLISQNRLFFVPLSTVFSNRIYIFSLPKLSLIKNVDLGDSYFKKACFSIDSSHMYVLTERSDGLAVSNDIIDINLLDFSIKRCLTGNHLKVLDISLSFKDGSLIIYFDDYSAAYLLNDEIVNFAQFGKFDKIFNIDKGNYFLTDSTLGMKLYSSNGKKLSNLNFIIPRLNSEDKYAEFYYDFYYSPETDLFFYLTQIPREKKYNLYIFSTEDFSLQAVKLGLKMKSYSIKYQQDYLILKTIKGIYEYKIIND